jgi:hypothetical protein
MARFYFHFANGQTILDDLGTDLADLEAVRQEALATARELMFDAPSDFWGGSHTGSGLPTNRAPPATPS